MEFGTDKLTDFSSKSGVLEFIAPNKKTYIRSWRLDCQRQGPNYAGSVHGLKLTCQHRFAHNSPFIFLCL